MKKLFLALLLLCSLGVAAQNSTVYFVVIGSFQSLTNAKSYVENIPQEAISTTPIWECYVNGKKVYRVASRFKTKAEAERDLRELRSWGFKDAFIAPYSGSYRKVYQLSYQ